MMSCSSPFAVDVPLTPVIFHFLCSLLPCTPLPWGSDVPVLWEKEWVLQVAECAAASAGWWILLDLSSLKAPSGFLSGYLRNPITHPPDNLQINQAVEMNEVGGRDKQPSLQHSKLPCPCCWVFLGMLEGLHMSSMSHLLPA